MEYMTQSWLEFANQVETDLAKISPRYSTGYIEHVNHLIDGIREESSRFGDLVSLEKEACYLRINQIGAELKGMACFVRA